MCLTQKKKKKSPRYFQGVLSCLLTIFVLFSYGYVSEKNSGKTEDRGEEMYNLGGSQKTRGSLAEKPGFVSRGGDAGRAADRGRPRPERVRGVPRECVVGRLDGVPTLWAGKPRTG